MDYRTLLRSAFLGLLTLLLLNAFPALADSGHARIIRLSLVQGDVRFARDVKGDPLASQNATWEAAELNLPIRQGYVLATDKGRAEVEFENGAMAFLGEDTVLEFYDLSLADGAKTTRLVLRQGTASFYVNPGNGDYFSVTGGDFTVEAAERTSFRFDNFNDGSVVDVSKGRVSVLRKNKSTEVAKGQSLSVRAGDDASSTVGRLPDSDDFDRWVSGRIDSVATATVAAQQYVNSPYGTSGLADLYTYGAWYPVSGYGNCWRPYGVGYGWSPFATGGWYTDPVYGLAFIGNQPWGWLPYHYGGWLFDPSLGWVWAPSFGPRYVNARWAPVTGTWLRSRTGLLGIVPVHPLDARGKTPVNLARGVFPVNGKMIANERVPVVAGEQWKTVKRVPRETGANIAASSAPTRVVPSPVATNHVVRAVGPGRDSSIVFDPHEHRFVNSNTIAAAPVAAGKNNGAAKSLGMTPSPAGATMGTAAPSMPRARTSVPAVSAPPARTSIYVPRSVSPPPAPRASEPARGGYSAGGSQASSGARGWSASGPSAASSAGASRGASGPSGASGGGRPH
jgi:FecR protein